MSQAKRQHWWPRFQSQYWVDASGRLHATRSDGTNFRPTPENIGLERHLYTRFAPDGSKDLSIEAWFSKEIEDPFASIFDSLISLNNVRRRPFRPDPEKRKVVETLGYITHPYIDDVPITAADRKTVANYVAALVVRSPAYLARILQFHTEHGQVPDRNTGKAITLENMLYLFGIYQEVITRSDFMLLVRQDSHEFLFSDSGISVTEPWRADPIPFDIHFPLTPDIALQVLPSPPGSRWGADSIAIARTNNNGTDRSNRIALGSARQFVFSRSPASPHYIAKYFGKPAPAPYGYRIVDGKLEVKYDASRDA
jgi:hypothetical protein